MDSRQRVASLLGFGLFVARTTMANTVMTPWATPARGWLSAITSVWVPIIFTCLTVVLLVASRYMGDQDSWIASILNMLVKASLAGNAASIVAFFVGVSITDPTVVAGATLDELSRWVGGQ